MEICVIVISVYEKSRIRIFYIQGDHMKELGYNIFLIGFMGAGKSTISSCLHSSYGMEILEMDQVIEKREGKKISDIFAEQGEEYFRKLETELLLELRNRKNLVVSCGGGTPLRSCNVEAMRQGGKVIFLTATPETVLERVKDSHDRPVIENHKNVLFIASLMEKRREAYESAADLQIPTDGRSAEEICQELMQRLEESEAVR